MLSMIPCSTSPMTYEPGFNRSWLSGYWLSMASEHIEVVARQHGFTKDLSAPEQYETNNIARRGINNIAPQN
jgi:hypothetical protein